MIEKTWSPRHSMNNEPLARKITKQRILLNFPFGSFFFFFIVIIVVVFVSFQIRGKKKSKFKVLNVCYSHQPPTSIKFGGFEIVFQKSK
jgi:hypothetical protein